jgi:hypothetical protein
MVYNKHDDHAEVLFVFAIIGDWTVGRELDREQLAHIGANVRQQPGFLRGYWGQEEGNTEFAYAVVLFEDEATANMMAEESGMRFPQPHFASCASWRKRGPFEDGFTPAARRAGRGNMPRSARDAGGSPMLLLRRRPV